MLQAILIVVRRRVSRYL